VSDTSERVSELYKVGREQQAKFTYFLLALTAAALAFSVQITKDASFQHQHLILAAAVALWLLSFASGVHYLRFAMSVTEANQDFLQLRVDVMSGRLPNDQRTAELHELIKTRTYKLSEKSALWHRVQLWSLYLGAIAFITWHMVRMTNA
jgi:hypothetical protein